MLSIRTSDDRSARTAAAAAQSTIINEQAEIVHRNQYRTHVQDRQPKRKNKKYKINKIMFKRKPPTLTFNVKHRPIVTYFEISENSTTNDGDTRLETSVHIVTQSDV